MKAECNRVDTSLGIECPEVYLALGVIAQAFEDWEARKDGASSKACFWILNCDEDVAFWCELAHISPESLRCRALSLGCHAVERYRELPDRINLEGVICHILLQLLSLREASANSLRREYTL